MSFRSRSSSWTTHTIIDPLYSPARFRVYEKCEHVNLLLTEAHLRHGFSPYFLLDLERMRRALTALTEPPGSCSRDFEKQVGELQLCSDKVYELIRQYLRERMGKCSIEELIQLHDEVLIGHRQYVSGAYAALEKELGPDGKIDATRLGRVSQFFSLGCVFDIACPCTSESGGKPTFHMTEEGRIYAALQSLMRSFEVRRCEWLRQAGALSSVHRAATHSRLAHMVGCFMVAFDALSDVAVFPSGEVAMELGEYLLLRGELQEFLAAVFLHDLGHPPLSHTLEANPFLKPRLDHEAITQSLITSTRDAKEQTNWHYLVYSLLRLQYVLREPIFGGAAQRDGEDEEVASTTHSVLRNCGMNTMLVGEILRKQSGGSTSTQQNALAAGSDGVRRGHEGDIAFLHALVDSDLDFDRVDHIRRDSAVCGLSLTSFRVREMLQGMSVILPGSTLYESNKTSEAPCFYLLLCPHSMMYAVDLLASRRLIFETVIFSDENCFLNGVINQMIACAAQMLPHLTNILPFITDQILSHFLTNKLFLGTQVEKLNQLLQGKEDHSAYELAARWQLQDTARRVSQESLERQYEVVHAFNKQHELKAGRLPACVFYSNTRFNGDHGHGNNQKWETWLLLHKTLSDGKLHSFRELAGCPTTGFPEKPNPQRTDNLLYVWIARTLRVGMNPEDYETAVLELKRDLLATLSEPKVSDGRSLKDQVDGLVRSQVTDLDDAPEQRGEGAGT